MGLSICKPATDSPSGDGKKSEDRKIDSSFAKINILRFDNFFSEASGALDDAEQIRSGIEDTKEQGAQLSHTCLLLNPPKFVDTIQVLLWAASADNGGKILDADVSATHTPPFFNINKTKLNKDTYNLAVLVETYIKTIMDAPELLEDLVSKLIDLVEKTPGMIEDAKSDIENSSLSFTDKLKATANLIKNEAKLAKQLYKCKELKGVILEAKQDFMEMIPRLKDLIMTADEIGAKAAADKLAKPSDIFDKYFPGPKKTPPTPTPTSSTSRKPTATNTPSTPVVTKTPEPVKPVEITEKVETVETVETITVVERSNGSTVTVVKVEESISVGLPHHHHKHHHVQEF